ncbi:MAG: putative signaling protein [Acidimicrobiales bacterium]|nr:MAG: EAL domain-containing protein [Actinomycetota bacterium]MBV6508251.1 putative signaling protein [Acidimicrobiales bacterium]RIK07322.1 MAG: hypothetical protein DCC48_04390 [Acidobacteriota bacterium]
MGSRSRTISSKVARTPRNIKAALDLLWLGAACAGIVTLIVVLDLIEHTAGVIGRNGLIREDAVVAAAIVIPLAAAVYTARRHSESKAIRHQLARLSYQDALTGLPNRRYLTDLLRDVLADARRNSDQVAVLFIDLDRFKAVNDTYGHEVGDRLMTEVAGRLLASVGEAGHVARYGGDEFVAILTSVPDARATEAAARRIIRTLEAPFQIGEDHIRISAGVGVALAERNCTRPAEVLRDADLALYQAKRAGPGSQQIFDRTLRGRITPSTAEARLRRALDRGEFRLLYQPIVSPWTKHVVGVEAALCWEHPEHGVVAPDVFLPILEETGLIVPVGAWALEDAAAQCRTWQSELTDRSALNVCVDVSPRQLSQANFPDVVARALRLSSADPEQLCLEIGGCPPAPDPQSIWPVLRPCKGLGVSIALDGMGNNPHALACLRELPVDVMKLDAANVRALTASREAALITEHLTAMARDLDIVTIATGVESEEQVTLLKSMHCDLLQGPLLGAARPADQLADRIAGSPPDGWQPSASKIAAPAQRTMGLAPSPEPSR